MLVRFTLGTDLNVSYVTVPVEAIVHPLCVIPGIGLVNCKQQGTNERDPSELMTPTDDITIELSGRYEFRVCEEVLSDMAELGVINVAWLYDPK